MQEARLFHPVHQYPSMFSAWVWPSLGKPRDNGASARGQGSSLCLALSAEVMRTVKHKRKSLAPAAIPGFSLVFQLQTSHSLKESATVYGRGTPGIWTGQARHPRLCYSPRKVLEMYSDTWLPERLVSERCDSSLFSILLNCKDKKWCPLGTRPGDLSRGTRPSLHGPAQGNGKRVEWKHQAGSGDGNRNSFP